MQNAYLKKKNRLESTFQSAPKEAKSTTPALPNSLLLAMQGRNSENEGNPELENIMKSRLAAFRHQIPAAESEADKLSFGITSGTPEQVKQSMGERLGTDFSSVRFHTGESVSQKADNMGARAWTQGNDVYFGEGGFHPTVAAHELVHTAQQGAVDSAAVNVSVPLGGAQMWECGILKSIRNWWKKRKQRKNIQKAINVQRKKPAWEIDMKNRGARSKNIEISDHDPNEINRYIAHMGSKFNPNLDKKLDEFIKKLNAEKKPSQLIRLFMEYAGNRKSRIFYVDQYKRIRSWDIDEDYVNVKRLRDKLKNMARVIRDYPEMKGYLHDWYKIDPHLNPEKKFTHMATNTNYNIMYNNRMDTGWSREKKEHETYIRQQKEDLKKRIINSKYNWHKIDPQRKPYKRSKLEIDCELMQKLQHESEIERLNRKKRKLREKVMNSNHSIPYGEKRERSGSMNEILSKSKLLNKRYLQGAPSFPHGKKHERSGSMSKIISKSKSLNERYSPGVQEKNAEYVGIHELGHVTHNILTAFANLYPDRKEQDQRDGITTNSLIERAVKNLQKKTPKFVLAKHKKDSPEGGIANPHFLNSYSHFKKGQIDLKDKKLICCVSEYAQTSPSEMIGEAFFDVYSKGKDASPFNIELVKVCHEQWRNVFS